MKLPTTRPRKQSGATPVRQSSPESGLAAEVAELQRSVEELRTQVALLTVALSVRNIELPPDESAAMPSTVEIDAREAFEIADGFHRLEYGDGAAFRWTGPGHVTTLRLWLDRSRPLKLQIRLHSYGDVRNRGAVSLVVDGHPVALAFDDLAIRSAAWPTHRSGGFSTVTLHVPHLSRPSDAREMDERALGIAFVTMLVAAA